MFCERTATLVRLFANPMDPNTPHGEKVQMAGWQAFRYRQKALGACLLS